MSSQKTPNPPCLLQRTISVLPATTTDGLTVFANKHYTAHIEKGTLQDAIANGYIDAYDAQDALIARTMQSKRRKLNATDETKAPETITQTKSADIADTADTADTADVEYKQ